MKHFRLDAERAQGFHAADAEHDLLPHSHFQIAAVKLGRNQSIFGVVLRRVGVEQIKIHAADVQLPNFREHLPIQNPSGDENIGAIAPHFTNRQMMEILIQVDRVLDAVLVDLLPEIAVSIEQSDRDKV